MATMDALRAPNGVRFTRPGSDLVRRMMDVALACVLLVVCAPVMLLVTAGILAEDGLPILFAHPRLGQQGVPFRMLKFRKFHHDLGSDLLPLTRVRDKRMTRVGRVLCSSKLDELPQLWNVVCGEMAFVGPRPESLAFADAFGDLARVLDHKPGILGPSQVMFRDESALFTHEPDPAALYRKVLLPAKARIDLLYYDNRTILQDVLWIVLGLLATTRLSLSVARRLQTLQNEPELVQRMQAAGIIEGSHGLRMAAEAESLS